MSKYCVIGRHGFIGSALAKRLGDVSSFPTDDTKVVFHFGSYTHLEFEKNPHYQMRQTIDSFVSLLEYCKQHGIQFVFPSSALVYERETQFSLFKKTLEQLASCYEVHTLGLRIFPAYGPGENRTVISKWCREMAAGRPPVVFGDGSQARDFVYIDDVVDQILAAVEQYKFVETKVIDIGTGTLTVFRDIIQMINEELGTSIEPTYVCRPSSYSEGIFSNSHGPSNWTVREGIKDICRQLSLV